MPLGMNEMNWHDEIYFPLLIFIVFTIETHVLEYVRGKKVVILNLLPLSWI